MSYVLTTALTAHQPDIPPHCQHPVPHLPLKQSRLPLRRPPFPHHGLTHRPNPLLAPHDLVETTSAATTSAALPPPGTLYLPHITSYTPRLPCCPISRPVDIHGHSEAPLHQFYDSKCSSPIVTGIFASRRGARRSSERHKCERSGASVWRLIRTGRAG